MHFVTYLHGGSQRVGILRNEQVIDVSDALGRSVENMQQLIESGPQLLPELQVALSTETDVFCLPLSLVQLAAPIPRPHKNVFCVGRNYADHAKERGSDLPEYPVFFTKAPNTVIAPGAPILHHAITSQLDYEAELAVVIGKGGCNINRNDALNHVFGYTIVNDVTARDLQKQHQQWFKGKSLDASCPMGPAIVSTDEIIDPQNLQVRLWVNGELRQEASTGDMIFPVAVLIEWLSQGYTLEPGDIIATGTPAGVGAGFNPPRFLHVGDRVMVEIGGVGRLCNTVQPAVSTMHSSL